MMIASYTCMYDVHTMHVCTMLVKKGDIINDDNFDKNLLIEDVERQNTKSIVGLNSAGRTKLVETAFCNLVIKLFFIRMKIWFETKLSPLQPGDNFDPTFSRRNFHLWKDVVEGVVPVLRVQI